MCSSAYLVDYYLNSDFYMEHCENKSRPELNCDGKCILAQKLKMGSESEETTPYLPITYEYLIAFQKVSFNSAYTYTDHQSLWINNYINPFDFYLLKPPI